MATTISQMSRSAARMAKEAVNRAFESTLAEGLLYERRLFHSAFATDADGAEARLVATPLHLHRYRLVGRSLLWLSLTPSSAAARPAVPGLAGGAAVRDRITRSACSPWYVRDLACCPARPACRYRAPRGRCSSVAAAIGLVFSIYSSTSGGGPGARLGWRAAAQRFNYPQAAIIGVVAIPSPRSTADRQADQVPGPPAQPGCLPPRVRPSSWSPSPGLSIALPNGVVIKGTMSFLNKSFAAVNDEMDSNNPAC